MQKQTSGSLTITDGSWRFQGSGIISRINVLRKLEYKDYIAYS